MSNTERVLNEVAWVGTVANTHIDVTNTIIMNGRRFKVHHHPQLRIKIRDVELVASNLGIATKSCHSRNPSPYVVAYRLLSAYLILVTSVGIKLHVRLCHVVSKSGLSKIPALIPTKRTRWLLVKYSELGVGDGDVMFELLSIVSLLLL